MSVDYVDFVFHGQVSYLNTSNLGGRVPAVAPADVGDVVFRVSCEISAFTATGGVQPPPLAEGDSGYLPAGTDVHAVRGYPRTCRLTARREGRWVAYLAQREVNHMSATQPCALHARS